MGNVKLYADLHVHIGRSLNGKAVKVTAARNLTLPQALATAKQKGLDMIAIIDAHSLGVQADCITLIEQNAFKLLEGGGYRYHGLTVIPGTEVELEVGTGSAHFLAYFPSIDALSRYVQEVRSAVKNWQLGSPKMHIDFPKWQESVTSAQGIWMPAHVFTPHKGIYGNCCRRITECLGVRPVAIELGLSAERSMANTIKELEGVNFFSNSDAHSLPNIGREFNLLNLNDNSFSGLNDLWTSKGGQVLKNFGMPPAMGKYYRSYCPNCHLIIQTAEASFSCPQCHSRDVIPGVYDRVKAIADREPLEDHAYTYHLSLQALPGIGPQTYSRLLKHYGSEIAILHEVPLEDLRQMMRDDQVELIFKMRHGGLQFAVGGGGIYGKLK